MPDEPASVDQQLVGLSATFADSDGAAWSGG